VQVSEQDFVSKIDLMIESVSRDPEFSAILKGVYVPFLIPSTLYNLDIGISLTKLLGLVSKSFTSAYPQYEFKNFFDTSLEKKINVNCSSRLDSIYSRLEHEDVVGLYFPTFFAGYAIKSQRDAITNLPENFALSGALEIAASIIGSPSLLMKTGDNYPNGLTLSGVEPTDARHIDMFWYFEAYGWNLNFNYRSMVGPASEYFSGGITIGS
jgi:hypothetical protein